MLISASQFLHIFLLVACRIAQGQRLSDRHLCSDGLGFSSPVNSCNATLSKPECQMVISTCLNGLKMFIEPKHFLGGNLKFLCPWSKKTPAHANFVCQWKIFRTKAGVEISGSETPLAFISRFNTGINMVDIQSKLNFQISLMIYPAPLAASRLASIQLHRESPWNAWIPPRVSLSITPSADPRPARAGGSSPYLTHS